MRVALIGQAAFGEAVYRRLLEQGEDIVGVFYEREGDGPPLVLMRRRPKRSFSSASV